VAEYRKSNKHCSWLPRGEFINRVNKARAAEGGGMSDPKRFIAEEIQEAEADPILHATVVSFALVPPAAPRASHQGFRPLKRLPRLLPAWQLHRSSSRTLGPRYSESERRWAGDPCLKTYTEVNAATIPPLSPVRLRASAMMIGVAGPA